MPTFARARLQVDCRRCFRRKRQALPGKGVCGRAASPIAGAEERRARGRALPGPTRRMRPGGLRTRTAPHPGLLLFMEEGVPHAARGAEGD